MTSTSKIDVKVRPVTDDEVEFFFENGWVKLPGFVEPEFTAELLAGAKRLLGENADAGLEKAETAETRQWFRALLEVRKQDERFRALAMSPEVGRNAARLFGRDSTIRMMQESLMVKLPVATGKGAPTDFHQDTAQHMFFEANSMNLWLALDEVTPEMGSMQFYSGSHKLGNLGNLLNPEIWSAWQDRIERSCELSAPVHFQPGDVTMHTNLMIHGTGANMGDRPRWAWGAMLLPGDARYTGAASDYTDGLGLQPFGSLEHPNFPTIYTPGPSAAGHG